MPNPDQVLTQEQHRGSVVIGAGAGRVGLRFPRPSSTASRTDSHVRAARLVAYLTAITPVTSVPSARAVSN